MIEEMRALCAEIEQLRDALRESDAAVAKQVIEAVSPMIQKAIDDISARLTERLSALERDVRGHLLCRPPL